MTIGFSEYILTFQVKDFVVFSIKLDLWWQNVFHSMKLLKRYCNAILNMFYNKQNFEEFMTFFTWKNFYSLLNQK